MADSINDLNLLINRYYNLINEISRAVNELNGLPYDVDSLSTKVGTCFSVNEIALDEGDLSKISDRITKVISKLNAHKNNLYGEINRLNSKISTLEAEAQLS